MGHNWDTQLSQVEYAMRTISIRPLLIHVASLIFETTQPRKAKHTKPTRNFTSNLRAQ